MVTGVEQGLRACNDFEVNHSVEKLSIQGNRVLVKKDAFEQQVEGSSVLLAADFYKLSKLTGTVVKVGNKVPVNFTDSEKLSVGSKVGWTGNVGRDIGINGEDYVLLVYSDISYIIDEEEV